MGFHVHSTQVPINLSGCASVSPCEKQELPPISGQGVKDQADSFLQLLQVRSRTHQAANQAPATSLRVLTHRDIPQAPPLSRKATQCLQRKLLPSGHDQGTEGKHIW